MKQLSEALKKSMVDKMDKLDNTELFVIYPMFLKKKYSKDYIMLKEGGVVFILDEIEINKLKGEIYRYAILKPNFKYKDKEDLINILKNMNSTKLFNTEDFTVLYDNTK